MNSSSPDRTPADLPSDDSFWVAGEGVTALDDAAADDRPAIERLGPSPFPKGGFPVLGFLASVYEHVLARRRAGR
jgi:hypothetical protein